MDYFQKLRKNLIVYYHNLKFDGSFILNYLQTHNWKHAFNQVEDLAQGEFDRIWKMPNKSYRYSISDRGMWYTITLKVNNKTIEFRDSAKLLPFKLEEIGKAFGTKHQKLTMEYKGFRYPNCNITDEERAYIENDALVLKEALEFMFENGHDKLTIGSCCMAEYKKTCPNFDELFPNPYNEELNKDETGFDNMGDYIAKSYRGGWCYNVPHKSHKVIKNGITIDVNSLYPSMMHSISGNRYPVGHGVYYKNLTVEQLDMLWQECEYYYFIRFSCRFYLKENRLPFVQIKGNPRYKGTVNLTTSDVFNEKTGKYQRSYTDTFGKHEAIVTLTMTCVDFKLFREQYYITDFKLIDSIVFATEIGIFDTYLDYWKEIKYKSTGAMRTLAKLFMNNLYGKFATNRNSSFKVCYLAEDGSNAFYSVEAHDKKPGFIPIGSAITSYSRNFTIRAAQANYYGKGKRGFIYADTDSIHCDLRPEELKGVELDDVRFCCWKLESLWDIGYFTRQKTYIEHIISDPKKPPYYSLKCAGLPQKSKEYFIACLENKIPDYDTLNESEQEFFYDADKKPIKRTLKDFDIGLTVPGKLMPKQIAGGVLLVDTWFEMR